ncbi:MAG: GNVR domain-containing protein [Steroidobacteraceae bacterium]
MQRRIETMPEVEAELAQLTRDYDVLRARYSELLQQFETAKLSDAVGQKDEIEFSVLDPPAALAQPVSPPRLLLLIGVLVLGLGAGGATAFGFSKLNPVFDSMDDTAVRNGPDRARCRQCHVARPPPGPQALGGAAGCRWPARHWWWFSWLSCWPATWAADS